MPLPAPEEIEAYKAIEETLPDRIVSMAVGIENAQKKWSKAIQNWNLALSQLAIHYEGRLDSYLDL